MSVVTGYPGRRAHGEFHGSRSDAGAASFRCAAVMVALARCLRAAANWVARRLEEQRINASTRTDFLMMNERELRDIGLTEADVGRLPRRAWDPYMDRI
jgi:uncharacterized protein YjiS (DUF1127 family)